jgi:hypothetical protein
MIETAVDKCGLTLTMRGTLAKFPDCVQWHLKNGGERGTLEIMFVAQAFACMVHSNRPAGFVD